MKVYLDDERNTPEGWVRTFTPQETIEILKTKEVVSLSLDHDLGDDVKIGTGYDVLLWLEEQQFMDPTFPIPNIVVHSANPAGALRMNQAIKTIYSRKLSV